MHSTEVSGIWHLGLKTVSKKNASRTIFHGTVSTGYQLCRGTTGTAPCTPRRSDRFQEYPHSEKCVHPGCTLDVHVTTIKPKLQSPFPTPISLNPRLSSPLNREVRRVYRMENTVGTQHPRRRVV